MHTRNSFLRVVVLNKTVSQAEAYYNHSGAPIDSEIHSSNKPFTSTARVKANMTLATFDFSGIFCLRRYTIPFDILKKFYTSTIGNPLHKFVLANRQKVKYSM